MQAITLLAQYTPMCSHRMCRGEVGGLPGVPKPFWCCIIEASLSRHTTLLTDDFRYMLFWHDVQALAHGLPNEAALVRQPSVAAAVHQALPDMPAPPLMDPLSNTSSESRDLPEGVLLKGSSDNLPDTPWGLPSFVRSLQGAWASPQTSATIGTQLAEAPLCVDSGESLQQSCRLPCMFSDKADGGITLVSWYLTDAM